MESAQIVSRKQTHHAEPDEIGRRNQGRYRSRDLRFFSRNISVADILGLRYIFNCVSIHDSFSIVYVTHKSMDITQ
jgi:hypothetical protein